jgi:hypothetical protein
VPISKVEHKQFSLRPKLKAGEGGLNYDFWAKCDQVTTLDKDYKDSAVCILPSDSSRESYWIQSKKRFAPHWNFPRRNSATFLTPFQTLNHLCDRRAGSRSFNRGGPSLRPSPKDIAVRQVLMADETGLSRRS